MEKTSQTIQKTVSRQANNKNKTHLFRSSNGITIASLKNRVLYWEQWNIDQKKNTHFDNLFL